jgi:hypothetical protein
MEEQPPQTIALIRDFLGRELIRAKTGSVGTAVRQTPARLSCRRRIDHPGRTGVDRAI